MDNVFSIALFILILAAGIFLLMLFGFIFSRLRSQNSSGEHSEPIRGGNISIFFDKNKNVVIIPYAKDKFGRGKAVENPIFLQYPYSADKLGKAVRLSMKLCESSLVRSSSELMSLLGVSDWQVFSEGRKNISIHYQEKYGIVFNTTRRMPDGAYHFNSQRHDRALPGNVSDRVLGDTLLALLPMCRV